MWNNKYILYKQRRALQLSENLILVTFIGAFWALLWADKGANIFDAGRQNFWLEIIFWVSIVFNAL